MASITVNNSNQLKDGAEKVSHAKQLNFLNSFKPNYYFLRAFGLWPFSLVGGSNGEIKKPKITKLNLLWLIVSILFYLLALLVFFQNTKIERNYKNGIVIAKRIINKGHHICTEFSFIFVAFSIVINMCNRFKLVNALNMFVHFDDSVSVLVFIYSFSS